jgi:hypothetical protein
LLLFADELHPELQSELLELDIAEQLLLAAETYNLLRLAALCEARLAQCISVGTAVRIWQFAADGEVEVRSCIQPDMGPGTTAHGVQAACLAAVSHHL